MALPPYPPRAPTSASPPRVARDPRESDRLGQLPLDLRDTQLPWLEAQESEELRRGGAAMLVALAIGLVLLIAVGGGAIWYFHRLHRATEAGAAGGIIHAPAGPYKVRPADPGGDIAPGTGDTRFLVAEGRTRAVRVAPAGVAPIVAASGDPVASGVGVQVGAYQTSAQAEAAWAPLAARLPLLSGLRHRVVEQQADMGSVFALQAVTGDAAAGQTLCRDLRAGGVACLVRE